MQLDPSYAKTLVDAVDCALEGSEYGVQAWRRLRILLLKGRSPTLDEWNEVFELVDQAQDDMEGPGLRVDLGTMRIYR
jgi:hypothetical protein